MADVVYINEEEGKKRLLNNGKRYAMLLAKFKDSMNLDELVSQAAVQDWEKAQAAAHTIKGTASNLSLVELFNQSLEVETQLKGKSLRPESLENLKACFAETLVHIEKVIAKNA